MKTSPTISQKETQEQALKTRLINKGVPAETLCDRELNYDELMKMDSLLYSYFYTFHRARVDEAVERPARITANKANMESVKAAKLWSKGTPEDAQEIANTASEWQKSVPQFDAQVAENCSLLVGEIKKRGQNVTYQTLTEAFVALAQKGLLYLTPSAIGLEGEESVRGWELTTRQDFWKFLQVYPPKTAEQIERERIQRQSADEYLKEHPELQDNSIPEIIERDIQRLISTFKLQHPEFQPSEKARTLLLDWIKVQGLPLTYNSLEASFAANKDKLELAVPITHHGLISSRTDYPMAENDTESRPVRIAESSVPKRFSMNEILSWDAVTYDRMLTAYPELKKQLDSQV